MDYISILLSIISILQGLKQNKPCENKLSELSELFDNLKRLDSILILAKETHDKIEEFNKQTHEYANTIKDEHAEKSRGKKTGEKYTVALIKLIEDCPSHANIKALTGDLSALSTGGNIPYNEEQSIERIYKFHETFRKSLLRLNNSLKKLTALHNKGEYLSPKFISEVVLIEHTLSETLRYADKLILSSANVMTYLHYQISNSI